jgi:hypothetical protein
MLLCCRQDGSVGVQAKDGTHALDKVMEVRKMTKNEKARSLGRLGSGSVVHPEPILCASAVGPYSRRLSRKHHRRRGAILVWVALFSMVLILFVGLSLDAAKLVLNVNQLQNAADAAALAGALVVKGQSPGVTRQMAHDIGLQNVADRFAVTLRTTPSPQEDPFPADDSLYDIVVGRWVKYNSTFLPTLDAPNAVMVIARRNVALANAGAPPLRLTFGPIVGIDTVNTAREAIAFCNSSGGAGLIVLSDLPNQGAEIGANANINIDGGGVHINSTSMGNNNSAGAWIHGSPVFDAGFLNVVGTVSPPPDDSAWEAIFADAQAAGQAGGYPVMNYDDGVQHIDDPLAAAMLAASEPYVDATGMRLDLPHLLDTQSGTIPTWYVRWDDSTSTYDYTNQPTPGYEDTVGLGTTTVTDPNTGVISTVTINPAVNASLPPGYYPNGMTIQNNDVITLNPGVGGTRDDKLFIFGGGQNPGNNIGLYMTGGTLTGHSVTCYVTETFDNNGLPLGVAGVTKITGGVIEVDSPGDWTNQQTILGGGTADISLVEGINGIAIWQDPAMSVPRPEAHLNGNGNFSISGTIYLPDPIHLRLEGDLGDTGNQVLCGTASILGTAEINVNYDGRNYGNSTVRCCLVR